MCDLVAGVRWSSFDSQHSCQHAWRLLPSVASVTEILWFSGQRKENSLLFLYLQPKATANRTSYIKLPFHNKTWACVSATMAESLAVLRYYINKGLHRLPKILNCKFYSSTPLNAFEFH